MLAAKMASAYASLLMCRLASLPCRTSAETVEAVPGETEGRDILLIDDMTETAGTLCAAAELKKNGAKRDGCSQSRGPE